ncbi:pentatricopeptide repeat-containing protein-like [Dorcoceras hygrometricum]|uniref:Pentatricopeptide repeat-containing protein-like n=1 Tax=Dorcoceras hygrometricum TaxID=472368 RepID=A0A2Z7BP61_9LAMI|nr:pentatricopeptide repeat-containing protein-like [Dorcoceras hygrometricum]
MAPSGPCTCVVAALRMKQIALDNQSHMIRRLRGKLEIERQESATIKEGLEKKLVEAKKEHGTKQVVLEASHKTISGLTEIGMCMSKKIEMMKAKKQQTRESHLECHHKWQSRIQEAEDSIQAQHLIIEALLEEKDGILQTIQGVQEDNGAPAPFDDEWEEIP